jgi:hypothetical protein
MVHSPQFLKLVQDARSRVKEISVHDAYVEGKKPYTCPMNLSGNLNQAERTQKRLNLRGLGPGFTSESVPNLGAREQRKPWSARCEGGQVQGVKLSRVWTFRLRGEGVKSGQVYWALKV